MIPKDKELHNILIVSTIHAAVFSGQMNEIGLFFEYLLEYLCVLHDTRNTDPMNERCVVTLSPLFCIFSDFGNERETRNEYRIG